MLFFFDKDFAYILAEATRSLSLLDGSIADEDDKVWLGHSKIRQYYRTRGHLEEFAKLRDARSARIQHM